MPAEADFEIALSLKLLAMTVVGAGFKPAPTLPEGKGFQPSEKQTLIAIKLNYYEKRKGLDALVFFYSLKSSLKVEKQN